MTLQGANRPSRRVRLFRKVDTLRDAKEIAKQERIDVETWSRRNYYRPRKGAPRDWMLRRVPTTETDEERDELHRQLQLAGWEFEKLYRPPMMKGARYNP